FSGALLQRVGEVLAEFDAVSTKPFALSGICGKLGRGLDQRQSAVGDAGLQKAVAVVGDVLRHLPVEVPQMAFDGKAGIVAEQNLGRRCRLRSSSQLGE